MLKVEFIGGFNPFDFIICPLCGGNKFTSLSLSSVWCDDCNTKFNVRYTAGDPGCVVDAHTKDAYGPTYECTCGRTVGTWSKEPPVCCGAPMQRKEGYSQALSDPKPASFYWILKLGDYSSGYLTSGIGCSEHIGPDFEKEWTAFQEVKGNLSLRGEYDVVSLIRADKGGDL